MKLISLNIWCGKVFEPLMQFVKQNAVDADIFCFQEVLHSENNLMEVAGFRTNILEELQKTLSDFNYFYAPRQNVVDVTEDKFIDNTEEGTAIFVRKNIDVADNFITDILNKRFPAATKEDYSNYPIPMQTVVLNIDGKKYFINTIHGVSRPGDKLDTPQRIEQSKKIIEALNSQDGEKLLVGDFNLMPETGSVEMLNKVLRNLIKEFEIKDTRGTINRKQEYLIIQYFADYTFVSEAINVKDFQVPDAMVSDHCPMILEFE